MYVGHYMAWISAALLYALQLKTDPANTAVAPGPMAVNIAGVAGAACVIIAGWTTANPTIYRAGLAFQVLFRKWSRFRVTIVAGVVATLGAIFPALVMKLLDFVALYGLILMPMGTVIFLDYWVLPKLNLKRFYAEEAGISINWAAGAAWILTLCCCLALYLLAGIENFFLFIPGWFIAAALYVAGSMLVQRKNRLERGL